MTDTPIPTEPETGRRPAATTPSTSLMPKGRLEAFSDGVLAIVITIIVLELDVPDQSASETLAHALLDEWRSFAAYLISFVFVGGFWISHATATRLITRTDAILLRLNLVALFFVSFLPFTTSVMATHLGGDGEGLSVALYGLNLLVASIVLNLLISYAAREEGLVSDEVADDELLAIERERRALVAGQAVATGVAIVLPVVAVAAYFAIALGFVVTPLLQARRRRRR
jgi:uncharacterized membrane protein